MRLGADVAQPKCFPSHTFAFYTTNAWMQPLRKEMKTIPIWLKPRSPVLWQGPYCRSNWTVGLCRFTTILDIRFHPMSPFAGWSLYRRLENFQQTIVKITMFLFNQINSDSVPTAFAQNCVFSEIRFFFILKVSNFNMPNTIMVHAKTSTVITSPFF